MAGLDRPGTFGSTPVSDGPLAGVWGDPADRLTVLGAEGSLYQSTLGGGIWQEGPAIPTSFTVRSLTGVEGGALWPSERVGSSLTTREKLGPSKRTGRSPSRDVWAAGDTVWIVGAAGVARRVGSEPFEDLGLPMAGLHGVFGLPTGEVWVVGNRGAFFGWDGARWNEIPSPTTSSALRAVWADPNAGVWAAGDDGLVLHLSPGSTTAEVETLPTDVDGVHITALYGAPNPGQRSSDPELWAATGEGLALTKEPVVSTICE